ncbi:MAG: TlpA disulfide reductase family protein [Luteibacter sp.]
MKRIALFLLLAATATSAIAAENPPKPFPSEAVLRERLNIDPHSKLVLRGRDGAPVDMKTVLDFVNAPGHELSFIPDEGSGFATLTITQPPRKAKNTLGDLVVGEPLPAFSLPSSDGRTISSNRMDHDLTVISFFFYECTGCIAEIPALNAFHSAHPEVGALGITYDAKEGLPTFRRKYGLHWEIIPDAVAFFDKANIAMYPTLGIVDRHGRLLDLKGGWTLHPAGRKLEADDVARWVATVGERKHP